jgi:hypothetical protein
METYPLAIVSIVCLPFDIHFWLLFDHCIHCMSALRYTAPDYPLAIEWPKGNQNLYIEGQTYNGYNGQRVIRSCISKGRHTMDTVTASDYPLAIASIVCLPLDMQILITLWPLYPLYVCPSIYTSDYPLTIVSIVGNQKLYIEGQTYNGQRVIRICISKGRHTMDTMAKG